MTQSTSSSSSRRTSSGGSSASSRRSSSSRSNKRFKDLEITPELLKMSSARASDKAASKAKSGLKKHRLVPSKQLIRASTSRAAAKAASFAQSGLKKVQLAKANATEAGRDKLAILRTRYVDSDAFEQLVKDAFIECDLDESGTIDAAELWAGVLLLFIYLNRIPWGGRKVPPKKAEVMQSLKDMDVDGDGVLDYDEFLVFAKDLCRDVAVDISVKMVLMMIVAPMIAAYIRVFLMNIDPVKNILVKLPSSTFDSIVTAVVISCIPFAEAAFAIDSDKLSDRWGSFFTWFTEMAWLPEDFDMDAIALMFEGIGIGKAVAANNRKNKKLALKSIEATEQTSDEDDDSENDEVGSTGFFETVEYDDIQASKRTRSARERMRRKDISI